MFKILTVMGAALLSASAAQATITVDGTLDAAYGAAKSTVTLNAGQASYDFGAATQYSEATSYSIYLTSDADNVYGFIQADNAGAGAFANLYFDLDPANGNGSDIGFEVTNDRAFVAGVPGYSGPLSGLSFAISADNKAIEFSIATGLFTSAIAGLNYDPSQQFAGLGDDVVLRLSQSFNYTVAGGPSYGPDRLGSVTLGGDVSTSDVPEIGTWAMMLMGFGGIGALSRQRRQTIVQA